MENQLTIILKLKQLIVANGLIEYEGAYSVDGSETFYPFRVQG